MPIVSADMLKIDGKDAEAFTKSNKLMSAFAYYRQHLPTQRKNTFDSEFSSSTDRLLSCFREKKNGLSNKQMDMLARAVAFEMA